ncbi:Crotonobetainyl-CoA:carnitine CoA-transferase CaiB-like acyl-CoA transferase OS=Castellaniella defragrans OX=75697 GN=HNR28_001164 PE=3 SV=1 [Castellaniella defragrans]
MSTPSYDREWKRFCEAVGLSEMIEDPQLNTNDARVANRSLLNEKMEARLAQYTRTQCVALLRGANVPSGPVNSVGEAFDNPQVRADDMVLTMNHERLGPIPALGFPAVFGRTPCDVRRSPPTLGEHTDEVRNAKGF